MFDFWGSLMVGLGDEFWLKEDLGAVGFVIIMYSHGTWQKHNTSQL